MSSNDLGLMSPALGLDTGNPYGSIYTSVCVANGAEEHCHCTEFQTCTWTQSASYATTLRCIRGIGDPLCRASCSGAVDQGATMLDTCSGLEWEKKDTAIGSGADAANPHDVDNRYTWAGRCSLDASVLCQPTPAAAALGAAQTGGALGCGECGPGQGTCDAALGGAITTVWDWLDAINAAGFGGHADWRLPTGGSGGGANYPPMPGPAELRSLGEHVCQFESDKWCAHAALGPSSGTYWTSTTHPDLAGVAAVNGMSFLPNSGVVVGNGFPQTADKDVALPVRAVRSAP